MEGIDPLSADSLGRWSVLPTNSSSPKGDRLEEVGLRGSKSIGQYQTLFRPAPEPGAFLPVI